MFRIRKRFLALGGLSGAGIVVVLRRRRAGRPVAPTPSAAPVAPAPPTAPVPAAAPDPVTATPPVEMPGPSVTPPGRDHGSSTERAEHAEALVPPTDDLVEAETAAAAAEAAAIGGPPTYDDPDGDPAFEPVAQAGGGVAEGFEIAEADLIENATHGDGRGDPLQDAFRPEVEADQATGVTGEADAEDIPDGPDDGR
jgi:hypothetical protein